MAGQAPSGAPMRLRLRAAVETNEWEGPKEPQGKCFWNAIRWCMFNPDPANLVIHGQVELSEGPRAGQRGEHAWVEQGNVVIDPTYGFKGSKGLYYRLTKAVPEASYTGKQALQHSVKFGNQGPWHEHELARKASTEPDLKQQLEALRPQFATAAQKVYDEWDQDPKTDELNGGGICHLIADEIASIIQQNIPRVETTCFSHSDEQHVSTLCWLEDEPEDEDEDTEPDLPSEVRVYDVDINPHNYEHGAGYTWTKIPDVMFCDGWVSIYPDWVKRKDLKNLSEGW